MRESFFVLATITYSYRLIPGLLASDFLLILMLLVTPKVRIVLKELAVLLVLLFIFYAVKSLVFIDLHPLVYMSKIALYISSLYVLLKIPLSPLVVNRMYTYALILIAFLSIIQSLVYEAKGVFLDFGVNTLDSSVGNAEYSGIRNYINYGYFRARAFFGEPSYLGLTSVALLANIRQRNNRGLLFLLSLICVFLSKSYGAGLFLLYMLFILLKKSRIKVILVLSILTPFVIDFVKKNFESWGSLNARLYDSIYFLQFYWSNLNWKNLLFGYANEKIFFDMIPSLGMVYEYENFANVYLWILIVQGGLLSIVLSYYLIRIRKKVNIFPVLIVSFLWGSLFNPLMILLIVENIKNEDIVYKKVLQ